MLQQADVKNRQSRVQKIASKIAKMQANVEKKQKRITREQEKVAQEEMEIAHEQEEIANEQAEIANEQEEIANELAEVAQAQTEITKGQEEIAREQAVILKVNGAITKLSTVDAELQTDVLDSLNQLDEYGAVKPALLQFDSVSKTVSWEKNGSVQLTKLQYDIVEILYHMPTCQMSITNLEEGVWGKDTLPTTSAAKVAVSRLNTKLGATDFPFEVVRIKRDLKTVSVENPVTQAAMDITVQPEIEVYKLVRR